MAVAGSLTYDTKIDKNGFEKGLNSLKNTTNSVGGQIKSIVTALGIDKLISTTFNILNSSIDGAVSRLDTLNNYPKVMSNLGIASEDAQKSINKMSDKLSGLPTTLDEGALAVQRFTSANGNIQKSTDYFLSLNNAILAGGASTEIQSSALEQLSQAYAKGKPDMMEWRSLMTAMPAQLKQVATAMGYINTDELGEDLRKGNVSMEEFMDTIVKLNNEGTNGFQSFEEQAKNSTGGIATSITVAKTQVVKGVADIIQSLDQFLQDEGLGGISEVISNIGKKAKQMLSTIAEKLPNIISFLQKVSPAIVTIVTALTTYKIIMTAVAIQQAILNAVMNANPMFLIVSAIVALVAGFIYLWNTSEEFRNFWIGLWEGIKKAVSAAIDFVVEWFNKIVNFIKKNWQGLLLFLVNPFAGAFKLLYDNCEGFRNFINNFIENIKQFFINGWNAIVTFFTETIPQWIQNVIMWLQQLPYNIGYMIGQIIGNIIQFGMNIWNWITVELPLIIQGIIDWFAQLPGRIAEWLTNAFNNILQWATDVYNNVTQWISDTINSVIAYFSELPSRVYSWLLNTLNNVISWGRNMANRGRQAASDLFNNIVNTIRELPSKMLEIGKNIVNGLVNGIKSMASNAKQAILNLGSGLVDGLKSKLGIHSPSTLFRDEVGQFIPAGIAVGVEANTGEAINAIENMNDKIMSEMNRAVAFEMGSINAKASVKSNNSMLNVLQATFNIDGSVDIDGQRAGRIVTPYVTKTLKSGGVY